MSMKDDAPQRLTTAEARRIGKRLREERERLGMTQEDFAKTGGVGRATQYLYEQGDRVPSMEYLSHVVAAGADLGYLVLGERARGRNARWSINKNTLAGAYRLIDEVARDSKGRLLDLEYRIALLDLLCDALVQQEPAKVDWEALRKRLAKTNIKG